MYYSPANSFENLWEGLESGFIGAREFDQKLTEQGYCPCNPATLKLDFWSLQDAVLIYHDFDPYKFQTVSPDIKRHFIDTIDQEHRIFQLLQDASHSDRLMIDKKSKKISPVEFIRFLREKDVFIPSHLATLPTQPKYRPEPQHIVASSEHPNPLLSRLVELLGGAPKRDTFRRVVIALTARAVQMRHNADGKAMPKPSSLAQKSEFKKIVEAFNSLTNTKAHSEVIDPKWTSLLLD